MGTPNVPPHRTKNLHSRVLGAVVGVTLGSEHEARLLDELSEEHRHQLTASMISSLRMRSAPRISSTPSAVSSYGTLRSIAGDAEHS